MGKGSTDAARRRYWKTKKHKNGLITPAGRLIIAVEELK
jgi:hypothetical protein